MNLTATTLEETIVTTNRDYHALMNQVKEIENTGNKSLYERLLEEADDLANYIHVLVSDN